ncbi:MAG: helix-turn-helix domain-containing protein [Candidatus Thorarchaeota archaeon]
MVFEINIRFKHACPYLKLSKLFTSPMYSYCSTTYDVIQLPGSISESVKAKAQIYFKNYSNWKFETKKKVRQPTLIYMDCTCGIIYYHTVASLIRKYRGIPVYPVIYSDGWEYRKITCFNKDVIHDVIQAIEKEVDVFEELEINNIGENGLFRAQTFSMTDIMKGLTEKQKDVILQAYKEGYYEIPRKIKLQDLANTYGVNKQAVEKTLRKAENKIVKAIMPFFDLDNSLIEEKIK